MQQHAASTPFLLSDDHKLTMTSPQIEAYTLDLEVLRQFRVIFKSVRRHFQLIEKTVGISGSQLWAAAAIAERPGIRVTELAKTMSVHQTTASNLVEKLVETGIVKRERSSQDSRMVLLYITELGRSRLEAAPGPMQGILPDALGKMPYSTLTSLHRNLAELLEKMDSLALHGEDTPLADM